MKILTARGPDVRRSSGIERVRADVGAQEIVVGLVRIPVAKLGMRPMGRPVYNPNKPNSGKNL